MQQNPKRPAAEILVVDDEADIRAAICAILSDEGYATREAGDSDTAYQQLEARLPAMVLLDIWLQGSPDDGIEILKNIKKDHPDLPVVMISGHGTIETAVSAGRMGAYDFIEKPFEADRLLLCVERAIERSRMQREIQQLRAQAGGRVELIGESSALNALRQAVEKVGPTGSRVMISGPPGSGKEVVARMVHEKSLRAAGPFVVLNAANLAPNRMEEELFGAEPGALGQGTPKKIGTFEEAHGGTLFIDEVADMPLETQGKILRVLQDQTFTRLGGERRVEVDVRVVAATSRDLASEISGQKFREDLFYRLNVVPLRVPALRERRDDVPYLAKHFLTRAAATNGKPSRALGDDALAVLQTCEWPGNVRQLKNVIDWLMIMAPGDSDTPIGADMLPPEITLTTPAALRPENSAEIMGLPLRDAREIFERQYLQAQVMRFGNNISRTASFVGMERSALHRKLKSLGITGDDRSQ